MVCARRVTILTSTAKSSVSNSMASGRSFTKRKNRLSRSPVHWNGPENGLTCSLETHPVRYASIHRKTTSPRPKDFIFARRNLWLTEKNTLAKSRLLSASKRTLQRVDLQPHNTPRATRSRPLVPPIVMLYPSLPTCLFARWDGSPWKIGTFDFLLRSLSTYKKRVSVFEFWGSVFRTFGRWNIFDTHFYKGSWAKGTHLIKRKKRGQKGLLWVVGICL